MQNSTSWALRETVLCATLGERISTLLRTCLLVEGAPCRRGASNLAVVVMGTA